MKRFLWKMLFLLPVAVVLVGTNVWVDPAGLFHRDAERRIATYLLEGLNVANVRNHDERQVLRYYAQGLKEKKDVLVFGTSRSMVIDSSFFPGETLFNASVAAGTLRDTLANYQLFHEKGFVPTRVVLGVEPYMLNRNYDNKLCLEAEYRRALGRLRLPLTDRRPFLARLIDRRYSQLISPSYFQASLGNVSGLIERGRPAPYPTSEFEVADNMVRADGSLSYGEERRARSLEAVHQKAVRFVAKHPEELANFRELDKGLKRTFETFVDALLEEGIEVILLLAPYHPVAYEMMQANDAYHCVGEAQTYFRSYATQHDVPVYGAYDPGACGLTAADFYDAVHSSREALQRIFQQGLTPSPLLQEVPEVAAEEAGHIALDLAFFDDPAGRQ